MPKKYRFVVTPLGEVIRWSNDVEEYILGSVNTTDLARETLNPVEFEKWSRLNFGSTAHKKLEAKISKGAAAYFNRQARIHLTPAEWKVYVKVNQFQVINDGRFRVYGGIDGKPYVKLVTEFSNFIDQEEFWQNLDTLAAQLGGEIVLMDEAKHSDLMGIPRILSAEESAEKLKDRIIVGKADLPKHLSDSADDDDRYIWSKGQNHGRMERQVELSFNALSYTKDDLDQKIKEVTEATKQIWTEAGVGII